MILRHDCYLNCPSTGSGGCGKKFKITQKSIPLFQWRHLQVFHDERCATCRLKELKELIAEAKKKGQYLTEEGKEYLKELEEMAAEENGGSSTTPISPSSLPSSSTPSTSTIKLGKKKKQLTTEITIEDEKLVIEYSNGTKKTVSVDTNQLKAIRDRMKKVNKKSLLASELGLDYSAKNNPSTNKPSNQTNNKWW